MLRTDLTTDDIDDVLAGTFPASDPPAWTPGVARPARRTSSPTDERSRTHDIPEQTILRVFTP
jgi:hypothetical protein